MRKITIAACVLPVVVAATLICGIKVDHKEDVGASTQEIFDLTDEQRDQLSERVRDSNDNQAAFRLALYYSFSKYDESSGEMWLQEAARLGNKPAQNSISKGVRIEKSSTP